MKTADILERIAGLRVLVLGDVALDRWCRYDPAIGEPSRETGINRIAVVSTETTPGAAGTVASNAAALGARVTLLSAVGLDGHGFELRKALAARGIGAELIESPELATFTYTKLINSETGREDLPRIDFVNAQPPPAQVLSAMVARFDELAANADVILVSDQVETPEGGLVGADLREALPQAHSLVWVDSRARAEQFRGVIIKGNRDEMEAASVRALGHFNLQALREHTSSPLLIMTAGDADTVLVTPEGSARVPPRKIANLVDICGAGDSFSAGAALALRVTGDPIAAAQFGHLVASLTVMKQGTGTASPAELLAAQMLD